MKRNILISLVAGTALTMSAFSARPVAADDETHDVEIKIVAPLDAVDCTTTPATITVLGLTVDVSAATIEVQGSATPVPTPTATPTAGDDGSHGHSSSRPGTIPGCYYYCATPTVPSAQPVSSCAALVAGQPVEVHLASDGAPLAATDVKQDGNNAVEDEVKAPLQLIDAGAKTITMLGLTIDVSGAGVDGSSDDGSTSAPIDLTQLIVGQFAEVKLASNIAPLVATDLEVKNFTNQIALEMDDASWNPLDDVDAAGNPADDIQVDVSEMVVVQNPPAAPGAAATGRKLKRVLFHSTTNGSVVLTGLPTGAATISVTRLSNGLTTVGRRGLMVRGDTTRSIRLRLRSRTH